MVVNSSTTRSPPSSSPSLSSTFSSTFSKSIAQRRQQKKMSITQTYYLAHTARKKLTREASRADHDLRLLVGHANLLDSLMLDLADAEQEQERWFNQTVNGASKSSQTSQPRHIQWADALIEEPEEDWDPEDASDLDSDSDDSDSDAEDYEEEPVFATIKMPIRQRAPSPVAVITEKEVDEDYDSDSDSDFEYDDVEDLDELILTRSPSRQTPPELSSDSDEDSEDDATPPSPPQPTLASFSEKQPQSAELPLADPEYGPGYYVTGQEQSTFIEAY
ncbi:hypothetical protein IFM51744_01846 [Aspergillus udagawae]|nr:hypothetical protein IFM51744_01846 [Aspergillus udagawae]